MSQYRQHEDNLNYWIASIGKPALYALSSLCVLCTPYLAYHFPALKWRVFPLSAATVAWAGGAYLEILQRQSGRRRQAVASVELDAAQAWAKLHLLPPDQSKIEEAGEIPPVYPHPSEKYHAIASLLLDYLQAKKLPCNWGRALDAPAFTRFYLSPLRNTDSKKLLGLSGDIEAKLAIPSPSLQVKPGYVALDFARGDREFPQFDSLPSSPSRGELVGAIGLDCDRSLQTIDFGDSNTPHGLVAGATGSGKTEAILTLLASLMRWYSPDDFRIVGCDPKRDGLTPLKGSPYLHSPLVFGTGEIVEKLESLELLRDARQQTFAEKSCKGIAEYNRRYCDRRLFRIVVVIDEITIIIRDPKFGKKAIDLLVQFLAAGRSAGIHFVLGTQYPKKENLPTVISANLGWRLCGVTRTNTGGRVALGIESVNTVALQGKGDMLGIFGGSKLTRIQCLYLPDKSILGGGDRAYSQQQPTTNSHSEPLLDPRTGAANHLELLLQKNLGNVEPSEPLSGDPVNPFAMTSVQQAELVRCVQKGWSQNAICRDFFKVKKGSGAKYTEATRLIQLLKRQYDA